MVVVPISIPTLSSWREAVRLPASKPFHRRRHLSAPVIATPIAAHAADQLADNHRERPRPCRQRRSPGNGRPARTPQRRQMRQRLLPRVSICFIMPNMGYTPWSLPCLPPQYYLRVQQFTDIHQRFFKTSGSVTAPRMCRAARRR